MKKGQRTTASPVQQIHFFTVMANHRNHGAPTFHHIFTREQQVGTPSLTLLELHRRGNDANWPPSAYEAVAGWCDIHSPAKAQLWRRFAYRSAEASAELEVTP